MLFVKLSFSRGVFWGQGYSPPSGKGRGFQPCPVSPRSWGRQMAMMLEPSRISHLIEENLAWDSVGTQLIGKFTQKRHWELLDPSCCFGRNLSLYHCSPSLPCSSSHMDGTLGNSDRVMAYWPDPHFSSYSHSKEENPHGMYMYKGWTY